MKKTLVLLLALVMCLSLCACGSKEAPANVPNEQTENVPVIQEIPTEMTVPETTATPEPVYETIEITMDNFFDYYEYREEINVKYNGFNEYESASVVRLYALKEEYATRVSSVIGNTSVHIKVNSKSGYMPYTFDPENKTYSLDEASEYAVSSRTDFVMDSNNYNPYYGCFTLTCLVFDPAHTDTPITHDFEITDVTGILYLAVD